jgi:uncharacterized Rmd1/YagE family protein
MICTAHCTAQSYNLAEIRKNLRNDSRMLVIDDAVHFHLGPDSDVFLIYGCMILWGVGEQEQKSFSLFIKPFENDPVGTIEREDWVYHYGDTTKIYHDELLIDQQNIIPAKLAVSYGIAQSLKLAFFERQIDKTMEETQYLPHHMAKYGKIPLSRREMCRKIGELLVARNYVNLHSDILDIPGYFWNHQELESTYKITISHLDVKSRTEVLNKRLDIMRDLFEMLGHELEHRHSSYLEWVIISLICMEIVLTILIHFLQATSDLS